MSSDNSNCSGSGIHGETPSHFAKSMNFTDFLTQGYIDAITRAFNDPDNAIRFIVKFGYPRERVPVFHEPQSFWFRVASEIDNGIINGKNLSSLFFSAAGEYPDIIKSIPNPGSLRQDFSLQGIIERKRLEYLKESVVHVRIRVSESGELFDEWFYRWLVNGVQSGALLLSRIGSGKTFATAQLVMQTWIRVVREDRKLGPVLWLRMQDFDLVSADPDIAVAHYLNTESSRSVWQAQPPISCVILDGFDEALLRHEVRALFRWLGTFLTRVGQQKPQPKVMITGREIILRPLLYTHQLLDYLSEYSKTPMGAGRSRNSKNPEIITLDECHDQTLRKVLSQRLHEGFGVPIEQSRELVARVRCGLMSSPIFFGFASKLLHSYLEFDQQDLLSEFASEWELTEAWIMDAFEREPLPAEPPFAPVERRREAAENIALCLVLTGAGAHGLSVTSLQEEMAGFGLPPLGAVLLGKKGRELRHRTLMKLCGSDRITPFHEVILTHLAACALDRLAAADGAPPTPPSVPETPDKIRSPLPPLSAPQEIWLEEVATLFKRPQLRQILRLLGEARDLRSWSKGSLPRSVLSYWVGEGLRRSAPAASLVPRFELNDLPPRDCDDLFLIVTFQAILEENNLIRSSEYAVQAISIADNKIRTMNFLWSTSLESSRSENDVDFEWLAIPSGKNPLWRIEEGKRQLAVFEVPRGVFLAKRLITVKEFAQFLIQCGGELPLDIPLPHWRPVGWKRLEGRILYDPERGNDPVVGITLDEAERYSRWRTQVHSGNPGSFVIPLPEWFQIAVFGRWLSEPRGSGPGPFGHHELTGRCWQWTSEEKGRALVFGGSEALGNDLGNIHATLVRGWPDLCWNVGTRNLRDIHVGFRLAFLAHDSVFDELAAVEKETHA